MDFANIPETSEYRRTPVYKVDDELVFGLLNLPIVKARTDTYVIVKQGSENRLDLVSSAVYGTPIYWWVIATLNDIIDPMTEVPVGKVLRVIPPDILIPYLNSL